MRSNLTNFSFGAVKLNPRNFSIFPILSLARKLFRESPLSVFVGAPGGGGGTPLYGLYRYVRPQRVWFFSRFGHKLGIDFSHFAAILVINRVSIFAL